MKLILLWAGANKRRALLTLLAVAAVIAHAAGVIDGATMLQLVAAAAGVPGVPGVPALDGDGAGGAGAVDWGAVVNGVLGAVASP